MRIVQGFVIAVLLLSAGVGTVAAQVPSLANVPVPRPSNLADFVRDEAVAGALGKALFWDMQVGSDGVQACATCHFRAGADTRSKNQVSPGLLRVRFVPESVMPAGVMPDADYDFTAGAPAYAQGPNSRLTPADFPLRRLVDPTDRQSAIKADTNNVVSSQGVSYAIHGQNGRPDADPDGFYVGERGRGANVRRVEPRNTPTMINAVFNHRNFWDMRAQHLFNGVNPFGDRDANAFLYRADDPANPMKVSVLLENSSLASQAVGPPTNAFEMSAGGRSFPGVGRALVHELGRRHRENARRLRSLRPLDKQLVRLDDGVLGAYSRFPERGLNVAYEDLIRQAFHPRWWDSSQLIRVAADGTTTVVERRGGAQAADEFTLMEYNFSLFFGLAVQVYESTLVAADTPFDRFLRDAAQFPLSASAERGRRAFFNLDPAPAPRGGCAFCHSGALLSEASVGAINARGGNLVRTFGGQLSDFGTRNLGVRETSEDLGNGGLDPFGASLSVAVRNSPGAVLAADGSFKIPGLRNVELTAPYFHTGGERTLLDVLDFYARGGNQGGASNPILTRDGTEIVGLAVLNFNTAPNADAVKADLVEFLKSLTDERVRIAAAPFDHPQLFVPDGHLGDTSSVPHHGGVAVDSFLEIPATGREGGAPLPGFLE